MILKLSNAYGLDWKWIGPNKKSVIGGGDYRRVKAGKAQ